MRLIDAESLKENLSKWLKQVDPTHPSDIPPMDDIIVSTIMTIEEEPTVDAVPIIRCKDCKYLWQEVAEGFTPYGFYYKRHIFLCQKHFDKYMGELREVMIDDFCSWAERNE